MKFKIPAGAQKILRTLNDVGYEAYLVGGCVRDLLRGGAPRLGYLHLRPPGGDGALLFRPPDD